MGRILFECPFTGTAVSTGIETEPISFCRLTKKWLKLYCPACGCFHGAKIWFDRDYSAFQVETRSPRRVVLSRKGSSPA